MGGPTAPPSRRGRTGMPPVKYHYSYRFFTYPVRRGGEPRSGLSLLAPSAPASRRRPRSWGRARPAPRTVAGGEFDWGGTPVKP